MRTEREVQPGEENSRTEYPTEPQQSPEFDINKFEIDTSDAALFESVNDEKQDK